MLRVCSRKNIFFLGIPLTLHYFSLKPAGVGKIGGGSGMLKKKCFFLGIPLTLHYFCRLK